MQWDGNAGRGFSEAEPWLPYGPDDISVASQAGDSGSLLELHRRAIWRRKLEPSLLRGSYNELDGMPMGVFAFERQAPGARPVTVVVNTSTEPRTVPLAGHRGSVLVSTDPSVEGSAVRGSVTVAALGALMIAGADPAAPLVS